MEDYLTSENELVKKHFNLEEILAFQMKHDVQIIRGADYSYTGYIEGRSYSTALTPMWALVHGIMLYNADKAKWEGINEGILTRATKEAIEYRSGTLSMQQVGEFSKEVANSEPNHYHDAITDAISNMLGVNQPNTAALTMQYEARCKHCAMCEKVGKRKYWCGNKESERYNQQITLRDVCCSKFQLTN